MSNKMDALKALEMATPALCRSNLIPRRWEWLSLMMFSIVFHDCCLLLSTSENASIHAGNVWNGGPEFADVTGFTGITSQAAAAKTASVYTLMCLVLSVGAVKLVLRDSGIARPGRDQLLIVGFVLWCLLLPSTSESTPIQAGFTTNITDNFGNYDFEELSLPFLMSPANRSSLVLEISKTKNWGTTCYLVVAVQRPTTDVNTTEYVPWSAPCPRKLMPNGKCTFAFTLDGDMQLSTDVGGRYNVVWSSNTTGLGATTLDVLDSDPTGSGSIVLYNNRSEVVWRNVLNMTNQDFQCSIPNSAAADLRISFASRSLLLVLSTALLLTFLAL